MDTSPLPEGLLEGLPKGSAALVHAPRLSSAPDPQQQHFDQRQQQHQTPQPSLTASWDPAAHGGPQGSPARAPAPAPALVGSESESGGRASPPPAASPPTPCPAVTSAPPAPSPGVDSPVPPSKQQPGQAATKHRRRSHRRQRRRRRAVSSAS